MANASGSGFFSGNAWLILGLVAAALVMFVVLFAMIDEPAQQQAETPVATEQAPPPAQQ